MNYTTGYDDKYKCVFCKKYFTDVSDLIKSEWRCPTCGEYIYIEAPELKDGHLMVRKKVAELRQLDNVHQRGEIYPFIGLTQLKNGKVKISLRGFGSIDAMPTDFVDVIEGAL